MKQEQHFKKILHNAKLKSTNPRLAVLEVLSEIKRPETAQGIHKHLKKIDLVTLYRTLASFEKSKLVKRIDMHKDAVCYELDTKHHHHIICTDCGKSEDFELCEMSHLTKKIATRSANFKNIQEHALELFGICNTCVRNT